METEGEAEKIKSSTNIRETEEEPIYQTALSKVESIKLQVPSGNYKVRLYFANLGGEKPLVYELKNQDAADANQFRESQSFGEREKGGHCQKSRNFTREKSTLQIKTSAEINIEAPAGKAFAISGILLEKTD